MPILSRLTLLALLVGMNGAAFGASASADGLVSTQSPYSVAETVERFEKRAQDKGLKIFAVVEHAQGAAEVDMTLRPTTVVIFGNPKGGTPFMQCAQTVGIDLPLKALVWEDAAGQTWMGYNDPAYIAKRHGVPDCKPVQPISKALAGLTQATVAEKESD